MRPRRALSVPVDQAVNRGSVEAVPQQKLGNQQKQQSSQQQQGAEDGKEQSFCTDGCHQSKGNLEKPKYRGKLYLQSSVLPDF